MSEDASQPDAPRALSILLVVEDDPTANRLDAVLAQSESTRFETTRELRIEDALLRLQEDAFDAMLIDLSLHEASGLDSLMRARAAASSIPIVVLTYQRDEQTALRAARAGAQDYLAKGEVTPELIARTLVHAIERHRILQDLTAAERRHHFLATHDSLTELPNRHCFMGHLARSVATAERRECQVAVFFVDLDGFKAVNDNLGHAIGDELLVDVAARMRRVIRKQDLVARIGGDEFLAAVQDVPSEETALSLADALRQEIERPYHLAGHECWVSASIGIAIFPQHGREPEQLIQSADAAMYEAKGAGKNCAHLFNVEMSTKAAERFELINSLREAIHSGQLRLMFQPQVDVATERIVGVETLVRWQHPTRGLVSPDDFIGIAEETGVMVQLGEWVLRAACEAAVRWEGLDGARVAVNVSGRQIDHPGFAGRVARILEETGLAPGRLEIELTETIAASNGALEVVQALREQGVRVAVDDFGTGYSTLTLLRQLDADLIKIDQSFVRGAAETDPDRVILEAIVHIARGLGMEVMAEGVERIEEMRALLDRGCSVMQGYLFSKPVERLELDAIAGDPDASWRIPIVDPESWRPPEEPRAVATAAEKPPDEGRATLGRIGLRSGAAFDPDEDLYPALKEDVGDAPRGRRGDERR